MNISYTDEQLALKKRITEYMDNMVTEDLLKEIENPEFLEGGGPIFKEKMLQMGEDGLLGLGWPKELGGEGIGPVEQHILPKRF